MKEYYEKQRKYRKRNQTLFFLDGQEHANEFQLSRLYKTKLALGNSAKKQTLCHMR